MNREVFDKAFTAAQRKSFATDPAKWEKWVSDNIEVIRS